MTEEKEINNLEVEIKGGSSDEDYSNCKKLIKKNKTLIALAILLAGIAGGSFFVDIAQLFSKRGFSAKALKDAQVVEYDGGTWVRYDDPKVVVDVFSEKDCKECMTDEVLTRLRTLMPTIEAHYVDVSTDEGKAYAKNNNIKYIPAFVFSDKVKDTDFYQTAALLFKETKDGKYYFDGAQVGIPVGKYIATPTDKNAIVLNDPQDPKVDVVVFVDQLAPSNKLTKPLLTKTVKNYKDDAKVLVKLAPVKDIDVSVKTAMASECANKQNAFDQYNDKIEKNQKALITSNNPDELLTKYATNLKLDTDKFNTCLNDAKTKEIVLQNGNEADIFGIVEKPAVFIGGELYENIPTYEGLKERIDAVLSKEEN